MGRVNAGDSASRSLGELFLALNSAGTMTGNALKPSRGVSPPISFSFFYSQGAPVPVCCSLRETTWKKTHCMVPKSTANLCESVFLSHYSEEPLLPALFLLYSLSCWCCPQSQGAAPSCFRTVSLQICKFRDNLTEIITGRPVMLGGRTLLVLELPSPAHTCRETRGIAKSISKKCVVL